MCQKCKGLGVCEDFDLEKIIDSEKSIMEDACSIAPGYNTVKWGNIYTNLAKKYGFKLSTPWKKLSTKAKEIFLYGSEEKWMKMEFRHPQTGYRWTDDIEWKGIIHIAKDRIEQSTSDSYKNKIKNLMNIYPCNECKGSKLRPYPSHAKLMNKTIQQWAGLPLETFQEEINKIKLTKTQKIIAEELIKEISTRLSFLINVGLPYLTIDRSSPTLSGGESQRVRLSGLIGSSLTDILYILDEPSIGLHPVDNRKLIKTLKDLQSLGNTIIIVEHDEETILASDWVVDIGPNAGVDGGEIIYSGPTESFLRKKTSLTANYLSHRMTIPVRKKRKIDLNNNIKITGASHNNLKQVSVKIPLNTMTAITGISGSGKSSLISQTLYPYLNNKLHKTNLSIGKYKEITGDENINKVVSINQSPIGRTPRSNPATYIGVFNDIRSLFASVPPAKAAGFSEGRFSFNVKEGSCPCCKGIGSVKVEMDFLADVWVTCSECKGRRFDSQTLSIYYRGANISDVLDMSIDKACVHFENIPKIYKKISLLQKMGLGYIKLGQSATTLSGGEAQRIKLTNELLKKKSSKTVYILDEPTTGLHFHDIEKLLEILHQLVDNGNSVIIIEHNIDLIKTCDYIIDLGLKGGINGGEIVARGTVDDIIKSKSSISPFLQSNKSSVTKKNHSPSKCKPSKKPIIIRGASEHNLKQVDLEIEKESITVFSGPSGSGKTSLAYNTIYAEAQRQFIETLPPFTRRFVKPMPKPIYKKISNLPPTIAIEQRNRSMNPRSTLGTITELYDYLRILYSNIGIPHCPETGHLIVEVTPEYIVEQYKDLQEKSRMSILSPINTKSITDFDEWKKNMLANGFVRGRLNGVFFDLEDKISYRRFRKNSLELVIDRMLYTQASNQRLLSSIELGIKYSNNEIIILIDDDEHYYNLSFSVKETGLSYPAITHQTFSFNHLEGMCNNCRGLGIIINVDEDIYTYFGDKKEKICQKCNGGRINTLASNVLINNVSLPQLCQLPLNEVVNIVSNINSVDVIKEPLKNITSILTFLNEIGLNYLSIHRMSRTLSTGELQRIFLTKELHKDLTGACYVLDEPTVGLHPANNELLNNLLLKMKDRGNTLIIVEHDPLTMKIADIIHDFGPHSGSKGGEITASGSYEKIKKMDSSITGKYLAKKMVIKRKTPYISSDKTISLSSANMHNIKDLSVDIPTKGITTFTGVSGAGKSSLVIDILYNNLSENLLRRNPLKNIKNHTCKIYNADSISKILYINQTPLSFSSRSDISTYLDILTPLRTFYSQLPDAKVKGMKPGNFSFNHKDGQCKRCRGHGHEWIDLHFLPPVKVTCSSCQGQRLNPLSLTVKYKGLTISEMLNLNATKALDIFPKLPKIHKILSLLIDTGLEYLNINRRVKTLSGGEVSRLKITKEILKKDIGHTLYIFDEPTTGLHFSDISLLIKLFDTLIEKGHGIWIIEHNTEIVSNSDYIIDIGPGAGHSGGNIVDHGPLQEISKRKKALITKYLT